MDRLEDGSIHESGFNGFIIETRAEQPKRGVLFVFTMKGGTIKQALESWQCLQFKESSIIVTGKKSFLPGLIDVAFLGWACHAGHLGRHAFEGIPEDAVCLQKTFKTGVGLTHSS